MYVVNDAGDNYDDPFSDRITEMSIRENICGILCWWIHNVYESDVMYIHMYKICITLRVVDDRMKFISELLKDTQIYSMSIHI